MGKLSDLIKWNYEYPINKHERFRNEVLSGQRSVNGSNYNFNRNPFIDDRNLACRIWGDHNAETRRLCAIYSKTTAPTRLELNYDEYKLAQGQTVSLAISEFAPADAVTTVTWSSSNFAVATVDTTGKVKAISDGEAIITATSTVDKNVKATCKIVVKTEPVQLTGVTVSPTSITVQEDKTATIKATSIPTNAFPFATYSYKSLNTSIATVSSSGVVTGVLEGNTEIEVTATQNSVSFKKNVPVTVTPKPDTVTVSMSQFTNTNDDLDEYISYTTGKGGGTSDPQINSNQIRLYQCASSNSSGGFITIKATNAKIVSVVIGTANSTKFAYSIDNGANSSSQSLSSGAKFTLDSLSCSSVKFTCLGKEKSERFYVNYLSVTYKFN